MVMFYGPKFNSDALSPKKITLIIFWNEISPRQIDPYSRNQYNGKYFLINDCILILSYR